ncbi:MAG: hypothetical protein AAF741_05745 [Bacteroidota bacterium]
MLKVDNRYAVSLEKLHLIAGFSLVASGVLVYFLEGIEMSLSWSIFGAMYISMSDVGEDDMSEEKLNQPSHMIRRLFGYVGACFSVGLLIFYIEKLAVG